ncbi:MAG: 50S ribosomal protein L5 [Patescibacteria group bacterium]
MTEKFTAKKFLEKVVINSGVGRLSQQPSFEDKVLPMVMRDVAILGGQKPQVRKAKKSIAGFKIRENQIVGVRATLRGDKMVDFFERFITIALPRVRDFTGLSVESVDRGGVLNVGMKEHLVFPEINPEDTTLIFPLQITIVPKLKDREKALAGFKSLGVPFKK